MTDNRPFHFLHFSLHHHRSTMKVGTDGILLGCWTRPLPTDHILDIGTGCGLLPLMLSQKGIAGADAVDLDADSVEEAAANFEASQWRERLHAYCCDIKIFNPGKKYDLIISNPPFFTNFSKNIEERKKRARHSDESLTFDDLLQSVHRLLKPDGCFSLVLPFKESESFLLLATQHGFRIHRQMLIVPIEGMDPNRINMEFRLKPAEEIQTETFVIRTSNMQFTKQYNDFLKDYYLGL